MNILVNRIITPDGTSLQSFHRHDYLTYTDRNGQEYMVDGGLEYLRRNINPTAPAKEASLYEGDLFSEIRKYFAWGSRGKGGHEPLHWIRLKDMEDDHINRILDEGHGAPHIRQLMSTEQQYRKDNL